MPVTPPPGCAPDAAQVQPRDRHAIARVARAPAAPRRAGRATARRGRCRRRRGRTRARGRAATAIGARARWRAKSGAKRSTVAIMRSATSSRASSHVRPGCTAPQIGMHVLAEQARDVLARRRERVVDRRRNQHLDDRLARPAARARIEVRALHVRERRRHDDAARMMRLRVAPGSAGKLGQRRRARRSCGTCPTRSDSRRCARENRPARARAPPAARTAAWD